MTAPRDEENNGLKPPRLPDVTRLNRNVLLVAGMGVAVVVLAVTHVVRSDQGRVANRAGTARVEAGTVADFLRAPVEADSDAPVPPLADLDKRTDTALAQAAVAQRSAPTSDRQVRFAPGSGPYASPRTRNPREEAYDVPFARGFVRRTLARARSRCVAALSWMCPVGS